jgi:hypothetical protein
MRLEIDCYHNKDKIGNTDILFTRKLNDSLRIIIRWYDYYWTNIDASNLNLN